MFGGTEVMTILASPVRAAQKANCGFGQLSSSRSAHIYQGEVWEQVMNCSGEKGKSFSVISFPCLHQLLLLSSFQCMIFMHWNHLTIKIKIKLFFTPVSPPRESLRRSLCAAVFSDQCPHSDFWVSQKVSSAGITSHRDFQVPSSSLRAIEKEWYDLKAFIWQLKGKSSFLFPQYKRSLRHKSLPWRYFHLCGVILSANGCIMEMVHFLLECLGVSSFELCFLWSFQ